MQDGLDFINGPRREFRNTGRYPCGEALSVSSSARPAIRIPAFVETIRRRVPAEQSTTMKAVMRAVCCTRRRFLESGRVLHAGTRGPSSFVVRATKDIGWTGFSVNTARTAMSGDGGRNLFEPPDVSGWDAGQNVVSRPVRCSSRNEFLRPRSAGEPEVQPREGAAKSERGRTPESLVAFFPERADSRRGWTAR